MRTRLPCTPQLIYYIHRSIFTRIQTGHAGTTTLECWLAGWLFFHTKHPIYACSSARAVAMIASPQTASSASVVVVVRVVVLLVLL